MLRPTQLMVIGSPIAFSREGEFVDCRDRRIEELGEKTMSDQKREIELVESPSRRSFLGAGSAALAAAAFVGLTADAQQREDARKAEGDRSSSNPGQENKPLLDENPNSNMPPPTDHGDIGPIWYSFDLARKRVEEGGWTHQVTERELPPSTDLTGVNMRLTLAASANCIGTRQMNGPLCSMAMLASPF